MIQLHHSYMICTGTYVLALLLSARHTLFPFHDKMSPTWQCLESFGSSKIHSFSCIHDYQNKHCVYSVVSQTRWPWTSLRISSQGNQSGHLFLHQIFPKMYLQTKSYRKHSLIKVFFTYPFIYKSGTIKNRTNISEAHRKNQASLAMKLSSGKGLWQTCVVGFLIEVRRIQPASFAEDLSHYLI